MKCIVLLLVGLALSLCAAEHRLHSFKRIELTDRYYSEGINAADIDGDGQMDIIHGPFWFAGPDFQKSHLIYQAAPQNREAYANNFFSWPFDFNHDGRMDVLTAGFPGTPAFVYENPGPGGLDHPWPKHQVFDWVSNESPHFTNLTGDDRPELVCTRDSCFGYATWNAEHPFDAWTFHAISGRIAPDRFGHGLGVGDVNGDGRLDVLMKDGWFEQPTDAAQTPWTLHKVAFSQSGGAEMFAYDVDGDGDNDVITSLAAHEYGLAWHEQTPAGFKEHLIMGDRPGLNKYGVYFSELHSLKLADIDGDGLQDIVTGKTYWSHHTKARGWNDGAVVYWFKLKRDAQGVDWVPMKCDGDAGIGRQIIVADVNADGLPDILTGGMKGANALLHQVSETDEAGWLAAQPAPLKMETLPLLRGEQPPIDNQTGRVANAIEGESLAATAKASAGAVRAQDMKNFSGDRWSGGAQLFWSGGKINDTLDLPFAIEKPGSKIIEAVFTRAPDFAVIQLLLDSKPLGSPLDLYQFGKVTTTGVLTYPAGELATGAHVLSLRIVGANPNAEQKKFVGLDYVRVIQP